MNMIQILKVYIYTEETRIFTSKCLMVGEILGNFTLFIISKIYNLLSEVFFPKKLTQIYFCAATDNGLWKILKT